MGMGGVQFAEVAVDVETGVVKVERIVAVHDCGRPINPKLVESQVNGGVIQGVSYALYEDRHHGCGERPCSSTPTSTNTRWSARARCRRSRCMLIEQLGAQSSTDARGVAEPANVATSGRDRQRVLQRHRKADPHFADEPGKCAGGARA